MQQVTLKTKLITGKPKWPKLSYRILCAGVRDVLLKETSSRLQAPAKCVKTLKTEETRYG